MFAWHFNLILRGRRCCDRSCSMLLHVVAVPLILLTIATLNAALAFDAEGDRAERLFLRQLTERQLFDLAEQYCRQQMARAPETDLQARWQLRLSQTVREHAWFAAAVDRDALLNQSLDQLSDFLKNDTPTPARQFELRLQQARILGQSVRMRIYVSEAGHLFGRGQRHVLMSGKELASARLEPSLITVANRAIAITEALLEQLDQLRKDLSPDTLRRFRNDGRLVLAELHSLKWRSQVSSENSADDAESTLSDAEMLLNLVSRSVGNGNAKLTARWLSAELALWSGDDEQFNLKMGGQNPSSSQDRPFSLLQVRALLRQQEASDALQLLSTSRGATALARQHLSWLQLETLLGRHELASLLNDPTLLRDATAAFTAAHGQLRPVLRGVFNECAERTVQRFHLVREVGAEIANLVEQVEYVHAAGDVSAALRLIDLAISRLPKSEYDRPRAGLLLRAGELLIEERKWSEARSRLSDSATLYKQLGESNRHAASDLLKVFTLAQLSTENTQQAPTVSSQDYVAALESHLSTFADQPTARRAQQWLLQQLRATDPHRAAVLVLSMMDDAEHAGRELELLLDCGRLLAAVPPLQLHNGAPVAQERFRNRANRIAARADDFDAVDLAPLWLRLLSFTVAEQSPASIDWIDVDKRLQAVLSQLPLARLRQDAELFEQFVVVDAVTAARTAATEARLDRAVANLLSLTDESAMTSIMSLHTQFLNDQPVVGDVWLARTTESLIRQLLAEEEDPLSARTVLFVLPVVVAATKLTGQHQLQDEILKTVMERSFDNAILLRIADTLVRADGAKDPVAETSPGVRKFWLMIIESNVAGSDPWLEASLQLATISTRQQKRDEARRRLGVVEALYPNWGSVDRLRRAAELMRQLRN
jgi:hypothetical protein